MDDAPVDVEQRTVEQAISSGTNPALPDATRTGIPRQSVRRRSLNGVNDEHRSRHSAGVKTEAELLL